jgi:hypothetical protein
MILIGLVTVCIGIPVLIIVVGLALLWLGQRLVGSIFFGG